VQVATSSSFHENRAIENPNHKKIIDTFFIPDFHKTADDTQSKIRSDTKQWMQDYIKTNILGMPTLLDY